MQIFNIQMKRWDFHLGGGEEPLKSFKKENEMDKFLFWKALSGCKTGNGLADEVGRMGHIEGWGTLKDGAHRHELIGYLVIYCY